MVSAPRRSAGWLAPLRSLRARIAAAFLVALVAMFAAQAWLIAQQGPVADSLELVTEGYLPLTKQVARLKQDQERVQRDLNRINNDRPRPVTGDRSEAEIYTVELRDNLETTRVMALSMRERKSDADTVAVLTKLLAYVDSIDRLFQQYEEQSRAALELADLGRDAREGVRRPVRATSKQLATEFELLERTIDEQVTKVTGATRAKQARARGVAVTMSALAGALGLVMLGAAFVALRPIGRLTEQVARVARGELGAQVEVGGGDEVALLATEFNAMSEALAQRDRRLTERQVELERVSRYLSSVVDSLEDGLLVVEGAAVTLTNPAATRLWGAEVGGPLPDALRVLATPGEHALSGAGDSRHVARSVRFGDAGVVVVLTDVTAQVRAQERLARSERLALIGQMLAQITHEVRNPLNALGLAGEILGDELAVLDPDRRTAAWELLDRISGEVDRLTQVTGHYLQLARRPAPSLQAVDVGRALVEVGRLVEPELAEAGVALSVDVVPLPRQRLDGGQLRQAVLNVVRNARESGGSRVAVSLGRVGDEVVVTVTDDGAGMDPEQVRQATDPFWSTKASGTGLGLAITRQIVEDHGGRLELESTVAGGTTVRLVLPWAPDDDLPDDPSVVG